MRNLGVTSLFLLLVIARISGADGYAPQTRTYTYGKWRVVQLDPSATMLIAISSTSINDAHTSISVDMKNNCTLGSLTLRWKAGNLLLDTEDFGVLSVRSFGITIADQPEELHTGTDRRSPDTDDRYFTFGGFASQRLYGIKGHGNLAIWVPSIDDSSAVRSENFYFSLDGFDRADDRATKLCKANLYSTPWAIEPSPQTETGNGKPT
jgi:hypothetical protein